MSAVDKMSYMKVVENRLCGVARDLAELYDKGDVAAAEAYRHHMWEILEKRLVGEVRPTALSGREQQKTSGEIDPRSLFFYSARSSQQTFFFRTSRALSAVLSSMSLISYKRS